MLQECTVCHGHHDLPESDMCPVCIGDVAKAVNHISDDLPDRPKTMNPSTLFGVAEALLRSDPNAETSNYLADRETLVRCAVEANRRAEEWGEQSAPLYTQVYNLLIAMAATISK